MDADAKKTLARASPAGFAWQASHERWIPADHLLMLSEKIVGVATGRIPRLIVCMPPRHGKSELISKYTPAWFLGRWPDKKVMLASYGDAFAASWGRRARDVFAEACPDLFGVDVDHETAGGGEWHVRGRDGVMVTAGVGGGITGKGADLLIIDDPVKNAQDAASETIQELHIDWWKSTARTRLMPKAGVILVMTRWHEADLAGRLIGDWINNDGDEWEVLSLPGIAEERASISYPPSKSIDLGPDPLGRKPGEALWPYREMNGVGMGYDVEALEQTRRAQGTYWFNAMYQQRPSAAEGNLFKKEHFRYYEREDNGFVRIFRDTGVQVFDPHSGTKFVTVDMAGSEKKTADYTVVSTWMVTVDKDLLLWSCERHQYEGPEGKALIKRTYFTEEPALIYVEKGTISMGIISELVREGLPIVPVTPSADKITRALPAVARYEEHRVFHPRGIGTGWVTEDWEPELLNFPNAQHDDQVDTVAYAALQLPIFGGQAGGSGAGRDPRSGGGGRETGGLVGKQF